MNVKDTLKTIVEYYGSVRGVGHTRAVVHGVANADAYVVVGTKQQIPEFSNRMSVHRRRLLTLDGLGDSSLKGLRKPLVFDNYAVLSLAHSALEHIVGVEEEAVEATERADNLADELKTANSRIMALAQQIDGLKAAKK